MTHELNNISSDFIHGDNLSIGLFNIIEEKVKVGDNVKIRNYVELRRGTIIGSDCYIDSRVSTSGAPECIIGNNVTIRYASIIARNVIIEDNVFISPQVGFINIPFKKKEKKPTIIKKGVLIGFNATIHDGVTIAEGTIIGAKANVTKDILKPGTYIGNPARLLEPKNAKIKKGKNILIEKGVIIGAQPYAFNDKGELIEPKAGVTIKDHTWIGSNSVIMLGLEHDTYIGENVKIGALCNIGHDVIIENGVKIINGSQIAGFAKIGKKSYIGLGSRIRNRVKIGKGSIIGMGSNVVSDIPDNVIAYGNPCKPISKREHPLKHYYRVYRL